MQPVHAPHAMVVSVHGLASQAGIEILQKGGNAVDAAVATGFVLAVVHPEAGNLVGGGFMLLRMANGAAHFVDYREKAPAGATAGMYLDEKGEVIPDASVIGAPYPRPFVTEAVSGIGPRPPPASPLRRRRQLTPVVWRRNAGDAFR